MMGNSLICKLINERDRKKIKKREIMMDVEISKLIKAFPKDIAALNKRSVLAKVNSQGSGRQKASCEIIPKVIEDNE